MINIIFLIFALASICMSGYMVYAKQMPEAIWFLVLAVLLNVIGQGRQS